jgi:hypothetical protein
MPLRLLVLSLCVLFVAGCGSSGDSSPDGGERQLSSRLVDLEAQPPLLNALDLDPETGDYLLTTNKGFWRIDKDDKTVTQIKGTIAAGGKSDTVGTFLEIEVTPDGRLIGSGHPDNQNTLPQYLGFIESTDMGKTWKVLARLGDADLHKIIQAHDKLYAFDAVLSALLISEDNGKTFAERFTPTGLIIDFAVDPKDENYILAATEDTLHNTSDQGENWRPVQPGTGIRLEWNENGLYRADQDGTVLTSTDRGNTWNPVGKVEGEPYKFKTDGDRLLLALSDGTIVESTDGGKTWTDVFRP